MVINMTNQNYLMVNPESVVDNICVWDGSPNTWQPPQGYTMLVQDTTPAMVWELNQEKTEYVLAEQIGMAGIGFAWNGFVLTTNLPKPVPPATAEQPISSGTQNA
jgi:hypothetical protein